MNAISPDEEREMRKRRRHEEEVRRGVEEHTVGDSLASQLVCVLMVL